MVKAWCAWCVCDAPLTVSYCELLYTTRRWLGGLVDHLGSWTDFTFQDWQAGRNDNEWLPCYRGGDGADRACAVSRSAGAPKTTPPAHQTTAANEGCIWAPAALGAPAKESRHRVTVCPSARPFCPSLQSSPSPRAAGTPARGDWTSGVRSQTRETRRSKGDRQTDRQVDEISVRKGPERRGDMRHSKVQYLHSPHVRHLHLTSANAWKDQFENLQFSQLSPGFLFPGPPTDYYYPVVWSYAALLLRRITDDRSNPSICPPTISILSHHPSYSQSVRQSVSERAGQSSNSSPSN